MKVQSAELQSNGSPSPQQALRPAIDIDVIKAIAPRRFVRGSGILLHPSSLPGPHGIGDFGENAFLFVDFLYASRQQLWQVLPLNPPDMHGSPYSSVSAFAGNHFLISLRWLVARGLLKEEELSEGASQSYEGVDFPSVSHFKLPKLRLAFERLQAGKDLMLMAEFEAFCQNHWGWLSDYALFMAIKDAHGGLPWTEWEPDLIGRQPEAMQIWRERLKTEIRFHQFLQFLFFTQWLSLKGYANDRGIRIVGDIPIFVAHDSADVWANQRFFSIDGLGRPTVVAGVPPDYFSSTGQLWGNPLYCWKVLDGEGYAWWIQRFQHTLSYVDIVRVDHFRGFEAYWEVPAGEITAVNGRWVKGPGARLFEAASAALGSLPIIAEDLGLITSEVDALRHCLGFPGMKVLQFAFGGQTDNPYLPHNYENHCVVYTGTHDNDTTLGWYESASPRLRASVRRYLGATPGNISSALIRLASASVADTVIVPIQDVLGLGSEARMNWPGKSTGNWSWRLRADQLTAKHRQYLAQLASTYGRYVRPTGVAR